MPNKTTEIQPTYAGDDPSDEIREQFVDDVLSETVGARFDVGTDVAGRYRVVRHLGAGGMGEVYAVHDAVLDTEVALKTLRAELEGSSIALERFRREIALARRVTDPHVCRVFDVGEHAGRVFLTMELVDGKPLAGPVPLAELERVAPQLVRGLAALHAAGIVHRDLKTANVLYSDRAVITDFGLARSIDQDGALTLDSGLLGTPAYMAPEQVEGRVATAASDVYALGVVLFELATGKRPFDEDTAMATATARLTRDPPKPSSLRADLPAKWDAIIGRCLARDPAARPAVDDVLARGSSRRTIIAAAGLGVAAAGLGAWQLLRTKATPPAFPPDGIVALLPFEGAGDLLADPLRLALSVDVNDRFATTDTTMLAFEGGGMSEFPGGTAVQLISHTDPSAAAWALDGVAAVVRMKIVSEEPLALEASIERRDAKTVVFRVKRPTSEATLLVDDFVHSIATHLRIKPPRAGGDAGIYAPEVYRRYGMALVRLWSQKPIEGETLEALANAEPRLARAAARAADWIVADGEQKEGAVVLEHMHRALALVDRALAIDPQLGHAHAVRGGALKIKWDWAGCDRATKRGLELQRKLGRVRFHRGMFAMLTSRFEENLEIALLRKRTNPLGAGALVGLVTTYYHARRYEEVVAHARAVEPKLADKPGRLILVLCQTAVAYAELARFDEAIATADRVLAMPKRHGNEYDVAFLVSAYVLAGKREQALALRAEINDKLGPFQQAMLHDALGEIDEALPKLEATVESRNIHALFINIERFSSTLRAQPRFQALVKRVGLA